MFNCNFNQQSRDYFLPTLPKYIFCGSEYRKWKQAEKQETLLATNENQYIYSYNKLVNEPILAYC